MELRLTQNTCTLRLSSSSGQSLDLSLPTQPQFVLAMRGVQGPSGNGSKFTFVKTTPALIWTINHNLGAYPSIQILTPGGVEIEAYVVNTSVNQALVYFNAAASGSAICR